MLEVLLLPIHSCEVWSFLQEEVSTCLSFILDDNKTRPSYWAGTEKTEATGKIGYIAQEHS